MRKTRLTDASQERGMVLLLVVVTLVMLTVVGAAYLQVARQDRKSVSTKVENHIDTVAQATIAYISEVLKNDVINTDDQGNFILLDGLTDEPQDYPYTNPTVGFTVMDIDGQDMSEPAHGGVLDDSWLASSEPDFTADPTWPHITNLNGIFLKLPILDGSVSQPTEMPVNNLITGFQWRRDTNVPITGSNPASLDVADTNFDPYGADADGDGILDSKWTWAPIRQIAGKRYVMAVRIIDNSAMLNVNTATSQVASANAYWAVYDKQSQIDEGTDAPRWIFPSELDMGNFMYQLGRTNLEVTTFLKYRLQNNLTSNYTRMNWYVNKLYPYYGIDHSRFDLWKYAGRSWNNNLSAGYNTFNYATNENELRYRNGLNNPDIQTTLETAGLDQFLRAAAVESDYTQVSGVSTLQDFFTTEPRHQLTTINGSAIYMSPLPGNTQTNLLLKKLNVNDLFSVAGNGTHVLQDAALADLSALVKQVIDVGKGDTATRFAYHAASHIANNEEYADQFAVSFADHFDRDNVTTVYKGRYGLEAWPVITEIYTQTPAMLGQGEINNIFTNDERFTGAFVPIPVGKTGYVIEIFNPHRRPVSLQNIQLIISYRQKSDDEIMEVSLPAGELLDDIAYDALRKANRNDPCLLPGQRLLIYHDSQGGPVNGRLSGKDDLLTNVINLYDYPLWQNNTDYEAGDVIRHDENKDGKFEEVLECLVTHKSNMTTQPTAVFDATYNAVGYHLSHPYWRRKLIIVDGGAWPVNENNLKETTSSIGNTTVMLRPYEMHDGSIYKSNWSYQDVYANSAPIGEATMPIHLVDHIGLWAVDGTYSKDQLVYANAGGTAPGTQDYRIYRCHVPGQAGDIANAPGNGTMHWVVNADENMYYMQSATRGSVDGIDALGLSATQMLVHKKRDLNRFTTNTNTGWCLRYEPDYDRLGEDSKHFELEDLSVVKTHLEGTVGKLTPGNPYIFRFNKDYTISNTTGFMISKSLIARQTADPHIDSVKSQLLNEDQGVTYKPWTFNRYYENGDIVHTRIKRTGLPDLDQLYICTRSHTASGNATTNKPGVVAGNWPAMWKPYWRTGEGLFVDSVAKLSHVVVAGPGPSVKLADIFGSSTLDEIAQLMMPVTAPYAKPMQTLAPWNIPHAAALMDRLTIHAPHDDGIDNDGDIVTDNDEEALVPGMININTIPAALMQKILPITDVTTRQTMAENIVTARKTNNGFSNIYQLASTLRNFNEVSAPQDNAILGGVVIDFHNPDLLTSDGIMNDVEEVLLPTRWLSGVASTRSDIFTAYVLIRGYPAGNFNSGAVEYKQFLVVFDRSNLIDGTSTPKILAIATYD